MSAQENFPETVEKFCEEIDKVFDTDNSDSAATFARIVEAFKKYDPEEKNAELLWRASKAAYKAAAVCEGKGDNKTRKQFLVDGEKYVDKALEINPDSGDGEELFLFAMFRIFKCFQTCQSSRRLTIANRSPAISSRMESLHLRQTVYPAVDQREVGLLLCSVFSWKTDDYLSI